MLYKFGIILGLLISAPGLALEAFDLQRMNGETATERFVSADKRAAIYIIEAYFYNCPYCHENAPIIEAIATEFKDNPRIHVLDIGRDCRNSDYSRWIAQHKPGHPVLNDCNKEVINQIGVTGFPTTVAYDCWGRERFKSTGVLNSAKQNQLKELIKQMQMEPCPLLLKD